MSQFLRLLVEDDKASALQTLCARLRQGEADSRAFDVKPEAFDAVPGKPFAYWVTDAVRQVFIKLTSFECDGRTAQHGGSTKDDFRFLRVWWESDVRSSRWTLFAKGGVFSPFYADIYLTVNWKDDARELEAALLHKYPYLGETANWVLHRECNYFRPGLTWPRRTQGGLSMRAMPAGCIFADKGPAAFADDDDPEELLALLALVNSSSFALLVSLQVAFGSYEVGVMQRTPIPILDGPSRQKLSVLSR